MSKGWKITLIVIGALLAVGILVGIGFLVGRGHINRWENIPPRMAPRFKSFRDRVAPNLPNDGLGQRLFNRRMGMQGRFPWINYSGTPLTIDESRTAVENYLSTLNNEDLTIDEIMVFKNNAYALIVENSTGRGAMELLVNPISKAVFPEFGPNMMWNLKYGHLECGQGVMGKMGNCGVDSTALSQTGEVLTINEEQARSAAQEFLDQNLVGHTLAEKATTFYGYYTFDYEKDGQPAGMLSVNGYTGQVWLHTWHGTFIEEWEAE